MRVFAIADASKRKAKPVGALVWQPCPENDQGRFTLEVCSGHDESRLPLSISFCAKREGGRATHRESEEWVRSRVVPESRHNIAAVLKANGLTEYSLVGLLAANQGRSSDDDLLVYEIDMPQELAARHLDAGKQGAQVASALGAAGAPGAAGCPTQSIADFVAATVQRRRIGTEVSYAFVALDAKRDKPEETRPDSHSEHWQRGCDASSGRESSSSALGMADGQMKMRAPSESNSDAAREARVRRENGLATLPEGAESPCAAQRIGALLRAERQRQGLSQVQLATHAGITQTVVSRVESGSGNPTLSLLEELASALGMRLDISLN